MNNLLAKGVLVAAAGGLLATSAAEARYRDGYRHRDRTGVAIAAGVTGLLLGASLASDRGYRSRYGYDRRYYYPSYPRYYRPYYAAPRYRSYYRDCYTRKEWDPYYGRRVKVRYCR